MHNNVMTNKLGVGRSDGGPPGYPHLRSRCAAAGEGEQKKKCGAHRFTRVSTLKGLG